MVRLVVLLIAIGTVIGATMPSRPAAVATDGAEAAIIPVTEASAAVDTAAGAIQIERSANGHFYANAAVNGASVRFMVDTGATGIALSRSDARNAGIGISTSMPLVVAQGAAGDVRGEQVVLDRLSLGAQTATAMPAIVLDSGEQSLLGQSFLSRFESVEIRGDTMVLR